MEASGEEAVLCFWWWGRSSPTWTSGRWPGWPNLFPCHLPFDLLIFLAERITEIIKSLGRVSRWTKGQHVRLDTVKLLEENIGKTFFDINYSNIILISLLTKEIKAKFLMVQNFFFNGTELNVKDFAQQRKLWIKGRDHLLHKRKYL